MKRITIMLLAALVVLTGCDLIMSEGTLFGTLEEENAAGLANGFAGGNGTADSPYLISNAEQFRIIGTEDFQNELLKGENDDLHFKLTADIDLSDQEGYVAEVFSGTLDGDGHTIYGSNDMPYIFHYFFEDTAFRDFTVEFADEEISRVFGFASIRVSETFSGIDRGNGPGSEEGTAYVYDKDSLTLTMDNVDYRASSDDYYVVGDANFAFYVTDNVSAVDVYDGSDFHISYMTCVYTTSNKDTYEDNYTTYNVNLSNCDVTGNYIGGFSGSGAAVFLGGQLYGTQATLKDCSFSGNFDGWNVALAVANGSGTAEKDIHTHSTITAENVTGSDINAFSREGTLSYSNRRNMEDIAGVSGVFNSPALPEMIEISGTNPVKLALKEAAGAASAAFYQLKISLPTMYWYANETDDTEIAQTDSNTFTIESESLEDLSGIAYKSVKTISRLQAEEEKISCGDWSSAAVSANGLRYQYVGETGNRYLVIDYGDNVRRYRQDNNEIGSIICLAYDSSNKVIGISKMI